LILNGQSDLANLGQGERGLASLVKVSCIRGGRTGLTRRRESDGESIFDDGVDSVWGCLPLPEYVEARTLLADLVSVCVCALMLKESP